MHNLRFKWIDWHNIRSKFTIIVSFFIVIFISLALGVFTFFRQKNFEIITQVYEEILKVFSKRIEVELNSVEEYSLNLATDYYIQYLLNEINDSKNNLEFYFAAEDIDKRVFSLTNAALIQNIFVLDAKNRFASNQRDYPQLYEYIDSGEIELFLNNQIVSSWTLTPKEKNTIFHLRKIRRTERSDLTYLGLLVFEINKNGIWESVILDFDYKNIDLIILNENDVVYANNKSLNILSYFKDIPKESSSIIKTENGRVFTIAYTSENRNLTYIISLPYKGLFGEFDITSVTVFSFLLFLLIAGLLLSILFVRSFTTPVVHLAEQMKTIEDENVEHVVNSLKVPKNEDEIKLLYQEFILLMKKIDGLINENYRKQILLKETQFRNLQNQINPHFLYNTLESINWLALMGGQDKISKMVHQLGKLLRSSINKKSIITLKDELDLLESYVFIQKIRFGERLKLKYSICDETQNCYIPKLILQPLVENSIKHGIEKIQDDIIIKIKTEFNKDNFLIIDISDNGPGIDKGTIRMLGKDLDSKNGSGIGIKNIKDRLIQFFNNEADINIESEIGKGKKIVITIKKIMGEKDILDFKGELKDV